MELMITLSPSINIVIIDDINVIKNIMHFSSQKRKRKQENNAFSLILDFPIFFSCHKRKAEPCINPYSHIYGIQYLLVLYASYIFKLQSQKEECICTIELHI